mmetsp:Transcript_34580/g.89650  ORF Transcript_34580/g.89650 Transcript_34580/m.89650 type:complete len:401 (-) Transcript_34580:1467-2669(-)|eukprot:CAMPEP_0113875896 /NCGR_PEP_ID=MMETSP0780_2-20120614/5187_1 /TAXON_ID=652834 /ORGANISM="Palpitomonas bilix" /LENGTH=400 /DNA_ID=CAMNT_0000861917 /DNA_START=62 /DNA_END=1264 /DNA_ORIENTATION=- /assembly_acc=CAM_ASM_000599
MARTGAIGLLLASFLLGAAWGKTSDVIDLSQDTFNEAVDHGDWMVEFFAPWCQHCRKLQPKWEEAATHLRGVASFGKVDCTEEKALCAAEDVKGYPTIYLYRDGVRRPYRGRKSAEDFEEFLTTLKADIASVGGDEELRQLTASEESVVVVVSQPSEDKLEAMKWLAKWLADTWVEFYVMEKDSVQLEADTIYLLRDGNAEEVATDSSAEGKDWAKEAYAFIESRLLPLFPPLGIDNYWYASRSSYPLVVVLVDPLSRDFEAFKSTARAALEESKEEGIKFNAGWLDMEKWGAEFGSAYSIANTDLPTAMVVDGDVFYRDASICGKRPTKEEISNFIRKVDAGEVGWSTTGKFLERLVKGWPHYALWQQVLIGCAALLPLFGLAFLLCCDSSPTSKSKDE